jgi:tetratricopeptide (TPR) repeat protein
MPRYRRAPTFIANHRRNTMTKMSSLKTLLFTASLACTATLQAAGVSVDSELDAVQQEWAAAKYEPQDKRSRKQAFQALIDHAATLRQAHPREAAAHAWEGIVLSTYAGEVGAMGAMKFAKAAREALHRAEALDPTALDGGIYASLGALYSKVPGGIVGFGDDERAEEYFRKALAVDPDNIDANFFYGEFLLEQGDDEQALVYLERALNTPPIATRPVFDAGRRAEIRALIDEASGRRSGG